MVAFLKLLTEAKHHSDGVFDVNARNGSGFAVFPTTLGWRVGDVFMFAVCLLRLLLLYLASEPRCSMTLVVVPSSDSSCLRLHSTLDVIAA